MISTNRCATNLIRVGEMPWSKKGATHYKTKLGLSYKEGAIKELVI